VTRRRFFLLSQVSNILHKSLRLFSLVCEGSKMCVLYPLTVLHDTSSVATLPLLVFVVVVCTILHAVLLISFISLGLGSTTNSHCALLSSSFGTDLEHPAGICQEYPSWRCDNRRDTVADDNASGERSGLSSSPSTTASSYPGERYLVSVVDWRKSFQDTGLCRTPCQDAREHAHPTAGWSSFGTGGL